MVPGAGLEFMPAVGAAVAPRRPVHHRRALVVRFVVLETRADVGLAGSPCPLEVLAVPRRIVPREEFTVRADARGDEILADVAEYRTALGVVRIEQPVSAPTGERRRELPAEVDCVLEPVVEAEGAVGRMAVRSVAGEKYPPLAIAL